MPKQNITLGEDGLYHPMSKRDAPNCISTEEVASSDNSCYESAASNTQSSVSDSAVAARRLHLKTSISSSISGPGIGDNVADKKAALLGGAGTPQVGRRETPESPVAHTGQKLYVVGLILAVVVLAAVVAIIITLSSGTLTTITP